ncbi:MAG: hypothetical protein FJ308_22215, partial [Planctomycetes bacterium]|nr:hypothetical protein [Planctomycetota bacterium]
MMLKFSWSIPLATADTFWVRIGVFGIALVVGAILITTGYHRVDSSEIEDGDRSDATIRPLVGGSTGRVLRSGKSASHARARLQMAVGAGVVLLGA